MGKRCNLKILSLLLISMLLITCLVQHKAIDAYAFTTIMYEAESSNNTISGSAKIKSKEKCSNREAVGNIGSSSNNYVTINDVYVPASGEYSMKIYYTTEELRDFFISVNGGESTRVGCLGEDWDTPHVVTIPVSLNAGMNSIKFYNNGAYAPNLDGIKIYSSVQEAEEQVRGGSANVVEGEDGIRRFSKGKKVVGIGNGGYVKFTNIDVPVTGDYLMDVYYTIDGTKSFEISVNEASSIRVACSGTTYDYPGKKEVIIPLNAGSNTIKFENSSESAPGLDKIQISKQPLQTEPEWNVYNGNVSFKPAEFTGAINNPLKGIMRRGYWVVNDEEEVDARTWDTLTHTYIAWDWIEENASDGIDKIKEVCNDMWEGFPENNIKVVPRIYLNGWVSSFFQGKKYEFGGNHWPSDMDVYDTTSAQFKTRVRGLIEKIGEVWDDDPRVAFVQVGIIGKWGENHSPSITNGLEKILGDAFTENFQNKSVQVRFLHTSMWDNYEFGNYNDSWLSATEEQINGSYNKMNASGIWKTQMMGGEIAYDYGTSEYIGTSPTVSMLQPHRNYIINGIRKYHTSSLMWLDGYGDFDYSNRYAGWSTATPEFKASVREGAEAIQKAFGYRFVMTEFNYPQRINSGEQFTVSFKVRNEGSAPFYYDWPVRLSLKDPSTNEVVWSDMMTSVDIREWLSGHGIIGAFEPPRNLWGQRTMEYIEKPKLYSESQTFTLPSSVSSGTYIIQLEILDPQGGNVPSVRFANTNYYSGGQHPMGQVGVNVGGETGELSPATFNDPAHDSTLRYLVD